jgi:hypothetical protein
VPETVTIQRIVVITDAAVEHVVLREIERLGFLAYSSVRCTGRGLRRVVEHVFAETSHVRIEALGSQDDVRRLMHYVAGGPLNHSSIVCFSDSVEVSECAAVA